jgi:hypothetical protein
MRRGLMGWDKTELPPAALEARVARLQQAMRRDWLDALILYTNFVRPSAVSWLTGFTPYWIESLLLVGRDGAPLLATALSKRVSEWIRATGEMGEIINTPKPGAAIAERLAAAGCKRVGILELDALPSVHYDEIVAAVPAVDFVEGGATFGAARRQVDAAEQTLIARADAIARAALAAVDVEQVADAGALAGLVEKHARLAAAEEAYIAVAPDLDVARRLVRVSAPVPLGARFVVRASVAYKGSWVRRTRSFARDVDARGCFARADAWLDDVARSLSASRPLGEQIEEKAAALEGAVLKTWMAESCIGSYPLEAVAGPRGGVERGMAGPGSFLVLSVELEIGGMAWLGAVPAFLAGASP